MEHKNQGFVRQNFGHANRAWIQEYITIPCFAPIDDAWPNDGVQQWFDEAKNYTIADNKCKAKAPDSCGHYIAAVWASSKHLGCAMGDCPDGVKGLLDMPAKKLVCLYAEFSAKVEGQPPYEVGAGKGT